MTTPHPHKDILIAIANGLPLSEVEAKHSTWNYWESFKENAYDIFQYPHSWETRIKPKTVMFNGVELPEPVTETPNNGQVLYVSRPESPYNYGEFRWVNSNYDEQVLKKGLIHTTRENAIAWAMAMTPVNEHK